ncbi:MAG: ORF6N domain-containing protein [Gallionella sp.]
MAEKKIIASVEQIESRIFVIRGQKVMLDADLAELYGVDTKVLNQAVKRNLDRFPDDFMFQLSTEEFANLKSKIGISSLRSQIVTSNIPSGRGGRRHLPYVFTEHGALMLGNVLKSERAVEVSLMVVRAFVRLRELASTHKELSQKLNQLERKVGAHDRAIAELINAIRQLMTPLDPKKKRPIGFAPWKEK